MALMPFCDALQSGPLVFDGAMGTLLYERGVFLNRCFEALNLTQPALVADIHRDYLSAGVDVIETNTYGANRIALAQWGMEDQAAAICEAGVRIARAEAQEHAYVAGALGPTGLLPKDLIRTSTRRQAFEAYKESIDALVAAGIDVLILETFNYLGELEIAVEAAYGARVPVIAQVTFSDDALTTDGASPEEVVDRLKALHVDAVGANSQLGPEMHHSIAERMVGHGVPVIIQPAAGNQRKVQGRVMFHASPETFGVSARRAFKLGVVGYGGCNGTTPAFLKRVAESARMMGRAARTRPSIEVDRGRPMPPLEARSHLGQKLADGEFVVSVELSPPVGLDDAAVLAKVKKLEAMGVSFVNIPDGPRATVRMSNLAFAKRVLETSTLEPILHVCGRDRNLLALQGDLLGAHALGIRNTVIVTGDPPKVGDYPDATAVFDMDSVGMLGMASGLNRGIDPAGKAIGRSKDGQVPGGTSFVLATGVEPAAQDFEREMARLAQKAEAGAEVVMTQPVYDPAVLARFLDRARPLGLKVLVGVLPLASYKNARFLNDNVPGMRVPDAVMARMKAAVEGDPEHAKQRQRETGVAIAAEALREVLDQVDGAYFMPPFGRVGAVAEVLKAVGVRP